MLLAGCQIKELGTEITKEQDYLSVQDSKPFIAIIENDGDRNETRTTLDNSGNVLWKQGDQISIFAGSTVNECYQVADECEGRTSATLNKISGSGSGLALDNNVAFYPYASTATIAKNGNNYVISGIELPAPQNYAEDSFDNGAFPMVAATSSTSDYSLKFKNVMGGLKLQLTGTATIASITVTGNNDEILCGDAEVTVSTESTPSINLTEAFAKTVTLDCGAGVTLDSEIATSFIITLPPMIMTGGFTVVVTDTEGKEMEIKSTRPQTITRSSLLKMPVVEYVGSFPKKALLPYGFLPNEIDKTTITEAYFHTSDPTTTATIISAGDSEYEPIYFEMIGTTAHFYTEGRVYKCSTLNSSFQGWESLQSLDLSMFNTTEVQSMSSAFMNCRSLRSLDLSSFDTGNVCDFSWMFGNCEALRDLNVSNFDTSKADDMHCMFCGCHSLKQLDVSSWSTSLCNSLASIFSNCYSLERLDVSHWDTSSCTRMNAVFSGCYSLEQLDISNWDTSRCPSLAYMFYSCSSLNAIDVSNFDTSSCTTMAYMFLGCSSLQNLDVSYFNTSSVVDFSHMFSGCSNLQNLNMSGWQTGNVQNTDQMFACCTKLSTIDLTDWDLRNVINANEMFSSCYNLKRIAFPNLSTPNLQNMAGMFYLCSNLTNISFNGLSTTNVTSMRQLFGFCSSLRTLDLSSFDTSNVTSMNTMFVKCTGLTELDLSNFDTRNVSDMFQMFCSCYNLSVLNLGSFDTSSLESADYLLDGLFNLTKLDLCSVTLSPLVSLTSAFGLASSTIGNRVSHCHIRCPSQTKSTIISTNNSLGSNSKYIWYEPEVALPDNVDEKDPNIYYSTDYSMDRKVVLKQAATEGNGLDIVIMGDGFSDRLIADGTYDEAMNVVLDAIFAEEPFKSFKNLFNIYVVYAVSENEIIGKNTAFLTTDSRGDWAGAIGSWDEDKVRAFAIMASSKSDTREITPIVVLNSATNDGSVKTQIGYNSEYLSDPNWDDYHGGENFTYISGPFTPDISYTAVHEMGHAFGQLADEYLYEGYEDYSANAYFQSTWPNMCIYGMYKNIDFTSDVNSIKWKHFLNDSRYTNECLNCYEGAMFKYGVWRPTENSIMRNDHDGHYNAPSREAIYYRIHKLAYGRNWEYNYEDFVQWDLKNIPQAASVLSPAKRASSSAKVNRKHVFKIEESVIEDGKKMLTIIQN